MRLPVGMVTTNPYVYSPADGYATSDLATIPSYNIRGSGLVHGAISRDRGRLDGPLL